MQGNGKPVPQATVDCEGRQVPYHIVCKHLLKVPQLWISVPAIRWDNGPQRGVKRDYLCASCAASAAYGHVLPLAGAWHFICAECFDQEYDQYPSLGTVPVEDLFQKQFHRLALPYQWVDLVYADA